jgi:dinuclear metal center YbgI/SA1388 family protein
MSPVRVSDIERAIASRFPLERAEEWDRCGLLAGDPDAEVTGVVLALDPTPGVISAAVSRGANVVVTHHPAFLTPPQWLTPGRGPAGVVFSALSAGVALINAHTNLDRDAEAQSLLPAALGLHPVKPVERSLQPSAVVTVFVPERAVERVVNAMAGAGAGRIGDYERCSFSADGLGAFTPPAGSAPCVGSPGEPSVAPERRVEMVAPAVRVRGVVAAAVAAHPYEEPLVTVSEVRIARNAARLGMVCDTQGRTPMTLGALVAHAASVYSVTPRAWGNAEAPITRVATGTGSAGSLIGDALAAGAQALIAGEVRYHDALDAVEAGLAVVELGHDVTEWPLVSLLEMAVRSIADIDQQTVHALPAKPGWWTP